MDVEQVAAVRSFSRAVTTRVGALDDRYLSRDRPLGAARLLWEIGPDGCEVAVLRARLRLDSAQLSRTLRAFERDGLVDVAPHPTDTRVRVARLTPAGRREWDALDDGSVTAAQGILEPLSAGQRHRLVTAMSEVERLLTASMVEITARLTSDPVARACLRAYVAELEPRFGGRFGSQGGNDRLNPPHGVFLVATIQGEPVGSGGVRWHAGGPPEVKRLWISPASRGLGLGRRLLDELEREAREHGATRIRLDTNRTLTEAMALYRSAGYREVDRFNDNPDAHHWFEKAL